VYCFLTIKATDTSVYSSYAIYIHTSEKLTVTNTTVSTSQEVRSHCSRLLSSRRKYKPKAMSSQNNLNTERTKTFLQHSIAG